MVVSHDHVIRPENIPSENSNAENLHQETSSCSEQPHEKVG